MKLRQKEYYCSKCNERHLFTELEKIYPKISGAWMWRLGAKETGAINPYFICNKCDYAEKLEYLEYPERKLLPSFLRKKLTAPLSNIKRVWAELFLNCLNCKRS